jgi:hypothetical protein
MFSWVHKTKKSYAVPNEEKDELLGYLWFHTAFAQDTQIPTMNVRCLLVRVCVCVCVCVCSTPTCGT